MHILWISDSPETPSGFGNVTRFVCGGLARRGHRVSILGWQAQQAGEWDGCRVYPSGVDPMGSDALFSLLVRQRPDMVIALADVWWLPYFSAPHVRRQMELIDTPWLLYFPIDGDTDDERLPPSWVELLRQVDVPIAMSRYGQRIAERCGVSCEYIPHGVDLDIFSPPADREAAKARIGAEGRFIVLSDCRNQPRKLLPRLLDVFARFAASKPDALLHLHTDPDDDFTRSGYYSYDVRADVRALGIEGQVRFSPGFSVERGGGLPIAELASFYQAADVHLLASSGEGFGLPTLQASAAGAVPFAGAYSASLELVEGHGEAIPIADWTHTQFGIRRAYIDVAEAANRLTRYYNDRDLLRDRSMRARQFAATYGWEAVIDRWSELVTRIGIRRPRISRTLAHSVEDVSRLTQQVLASVPGVNITMKFVQRDLGRLEAAILSDAHERSADLHIPTQLPPCQVGQVRVVKRTGYVGVAPSSGRLFSSLRRIFPSLTEWQASCQDGTPRDLTYELAQSILMLNLEDELPESLVLDAAILGVPCIGASSRLQRTLWPELVAESFEQAFASARSLLTDSPRIVNIADAARTRCQQLYAPDELALANALRSSLAIRQADFAAVPSR